MAVGHESERRERLALGNLGNVMPELFIRLAWIAARALRFNHTEDQATWLVKAIIGNAVPGLGVVAVHGNFKTDLCSIFQPPIRFSKLRINQPCASLGFVHGN